MYSCQLPTGNCEVIIIDFLPYVSRNYKCTENGKLECTENGNNGAQLFYFQKYVIFPHID